MKPPRSQVVLITMLGAICIVVLTYCLIRQNQNKHVAEIIGFDPNNKIELMETILDNLGEEYDQIQVVNEPGPIVILVNTGEKLTSEQYIKLEHAVNEKFHDYGPMILEDSETCWPEDESLWPGNLQRPEQRPEE